MTPKLYVITMTVRMGDAEIEAKYSVRSFSAETALVEAGRKLEKTWSGSRLVDVKLRSAKPGRIIDVGTGS